MILGTATLPHYRSDITLELHGKVSNSHHTDMLGTRNECAERHREIIARNYPAARIVYQVTRRVGGRA